MIIRHVTPTHLLISLVILTLPIYFLSSFHPDESLFLNIANHITQGYPPYGNSLLDNKPPGIYYLLSLFPQLLGHNFIWPRALTFIINLLTAITLYRITLLTKILPPTQAFIPALLYLSTAPLYHGHYAITEPPLALFLTLATYTFLNFLYRHHVPSLALTSLLLGISTLFKQTATLNILLTLIFLLIIPTNSKTSRLKSLILFLLPLTFAWIPFIIYFNAHQILPAAAYQIITLVTLKYPPEPLLATLFTLPNIFQSSLNLWLAALFIMLTTYRTRVTTILTTKLILSYLILSILIPLLLIFYRPYHHYLIQVLPFVCLLASLAYHQIATFRYLILANLLLSLISFNGYIYLHDANYRQTQLLTSQQITACTSDLQPYQSYLHNCLPRELLPTQTPPQNFSTPSY